MTTKTPYVGIDYGRLSNTNRNIETGIHYGAINLHSISSFCFDDAEAIYPDEIEIECPDCEKSFTAGLDIETCPHCGESLDTSNLLDGIEPITWDYTPDDPDYTTEYSESLNCLIVTRSPYYTFTVFCSPCLPGCGDLNHPSADGVKCYCLGPEFFDDENKCPYEYFKIER